MSKTKNTTKVATFVSFLFTNGEEVWADDIRQDNAGDCYGAATSCGDVAGINSFTSCSPGDRVILRANAPRSYDNDAGRRWVMTGRA